MAANLSHSLDVHGGMLPVYHYDIETELCCYSSDSDGRETTEISNQRGDSPGMGVGERFAGAMGLKEGRGTVCCHTQL